MTTETMKLIAQGALEGIVGEFKSPENVKHRVIKGVRDELLWMVIGGAVIGGWRATHPKKENEEEKADV